MAGTRSALRAARVAVIAFAVLLAGGAVGAWFLGSQALESARAQATSDASGVTDELLTDVFTGADLSAPVSAARAREIEDALERSALASSGFGMITVWRDDGQVVFSQDRNLLAARLPSEASHLRAVLRNGAASEVENGTFSAFVPLTKGTINAVAELDRPYAPIARSAVPLRIASGLLLVLCLATTYVVHRLSRAIASATANAAFRPTQGLGDVRQAPQHEQIGGRGRGIRARSVEAPAPDPVDRRRTKELEEQVRVLQEQFRNSLAELQATERRLQDATSASGRADGRLEDRALKAEGRVRQLESQLEALRTERDGLARELVDAGQSAPDETLGVNVERLEQESIALRAQLEGARTELDVVKRELASQDTRVHALQGELDVARRSGVDSERDRIALEELRGRVDETDRELQAARSEALRALAQRDDLVREAENARGEADKARSEADEARGETERARAEARTQAVEMEVLRGEVERARGEVERARADDHDAEEIARSHADSEDLRRQLVAQSEERATIQAELTEAKEQLDRVRADLSAEADRVRQTATRAEEAERELETIRRRQDETAGETADLATVAREAEDRLAVQTEVLAQTEQRAISAEGRLEEALARLEEAQSEFQRAAARVPLYTLDGESPPDESFDDRRAATPFTKELSLDAKKTLTQILGIALTLKHKKTAQDQGPLLRQLQALTKRLDRTVTDLSEADKLAHGEIELSVRRTNVEALVERVVEESGLGADHEVRVETEELFAAVDPGRTEQILAALLRISSDRTTAGAPITVRLQHHDAGILLSVEDKEPSAEGSLSPVVSRLADVMGGWGRVERRPNGGSAFRVYLPDRLGETRAPRAEGPESADDRLHIVVENASAEPAAEDGDSPSGIDPDDPWAAGQLLVEQLRGLSRGERK